MGKKFDTILYSISISIRVPYEHYTYSKKLSTVQRPMDIKNRPRIPIPDEDPYSIASSNANGSGSSGSSGGYGHNGHNGHGVVAATREQLMMQMGQRRGDKPPKLPPRENGYGPADIPKVRATS